MISSVNNGLQYRGIEIFKLSALIVVNVVEKITTLKLKSGFHKGIINIVLVFSYAQVKAYCEPFCRKVKKEYVTHA